MMEQPSIKVERLEPLNTGKGSKPSELHNYERMFKIILIGIAATGKTSIINRFVDGQYENDGLNTIGVDLKSITLRIDEVVSKL